MIRRGDVLRLEDSEKKALNLFNVDEITKKLLILHKYLPTEKADHPKEPT